MKTDFTGIRLDGMEDIQKVLGDLVPRESRNLSRGMIFGLAQRTAKLAKSNVPVDTGNLKKSIKPKRRRGKPGSPVADVIAEQGKKAKHDGYYWRFVEFGTKTGSPEQPFLRPAVQQVESNIENIAKEEFLKRLSRRVDRVKKKQAAS